MKKSNYFTRFVLLFSVVLFTMLSGQAEEKNKSENPLVGTWKFLKAVDADGVDLDSKKGEESYDTFLESGVLISFGVRANYPYIGKTPATLEEYQKIGENVMGGIYTYTCDPSKNKASFTVKHSLDPANVGNFFTANFKIEDDIITWWSDSWKNTHTYKRVK